MEKTNQKLLPLSSDIVFKRVFSREGTEDILKDFLEAILNIKIKKVEVKNPELPKNIYDEKAGVLDIKVEIDEQTICDVEMQVKDEYNVDKRSLKYAANLIEMQLKIGDQYTKLKKVIVINILKFNFYKRNGYHHIAHMKFEEINQNEYVDMGFIDEDELATDDIEMHFIELPKFKKKNPETATKLEQWLWLIEGEGEKIKMAKSKNEKIKEAINLIKEVSMDDKEWQMYESRQRWIADIKTDMICAKEEGAKAKSLEIAKKMLKKELPIDMICEITQLTKEEIEKIEK